MMALISYVKNTTRDQIYFLTGLFVCSTPFWYLIFLLLKSVNLINVINIIFVLMSIIVSIVYVVELNDVLTWMQNLFKKPIFLIFTLCTLPILSFGSSLFVENLIYDALGAYPVVYKHNLDTLLKGVSLALGLSYFVLGLAIVMILFSFFRLFFHLQEESVKKDKNTQSTTLKNTMISLAQKIKGKVVVRKTDFFYWFGRLVGSILVIAVLCLQVNVLNKFFEKEFVKRVYIASYFNRKNVCGLSDEYFKTMPFEGKVLAYNNKDKTIHELECKNKYAAGENITEPILQKYRELISSVVKRYSSSY